MKIFVVDDNPHVLALMQKSLEPHGEIEAFHDAGEALVRATSAAPDLIVSDFRMKGMDGRALLEKLRGRTETKDVPVILLASKADIEEELQGVSGQVEELVSKPFFARELVMRAKRVLDKAYLNRKQSESAAAGSAAIRGKLSEMSVTDLFQALQLGAKTCLLLLSNDSGEIASIYFGDGDVYHCTLGSLVGDAVVNSIVKWSDGTFELNFSAARLPDSNTHTGTQGLLMEAMRLLDEENR